MKKLFLVLAAAFAMVACQTDINEVGVVADGVATVEFEVGAPQMRSYSDGLTATKLQYAVYEVKVEGENKTLSYLQNLTAAGDEAETLVGGAANVKIELANNKKYAVIFWASAAVDGPYTFNPAGKTVTVDYNNAECNDESRDAFYAYTEFEVRGAATLGVDLRRPFAQVNVGTSDLAEAAKSNFVPSTSSLVVEDVFSTLNLVDGSALGNTTDVTFAAATVPTGETFPVNGHDYLAMSYVLVGKDKGSYDVKYTITAGDNTVINNTIGAVPMQANYRTNIYGKLLTSTTDINVEIKPGYSDDNKYEVVDGKVNVTVDNAEEFYTYFADPNVDVIILNEDLVLGQSATRAVDPTLTVATGETLVLDLNEKTLSSKSTQTGKNYEMLLVKGNLTVKNGTIETEHTGDNMEWNAMTTIFNITAGGVVNLDGVTAKNLGGSDMGFVAHLNNWGEVTLNAENCVLESNYVAVRVFNSGNDMNNVTIKNSTLKGGNYAFWVHNYTVADFGSEAKADAHKALLNLDVFNGTNTFVGKNNTPIRFGFTDSQYCGVVTTEAELKEILEAGWSVILAEDIVLAEALKVASEKNSVIDLNGHTLSGVDNGTASYGLITNNGNLTIEGPGKLELTATIDRDWNAYSSVISNQPGGNLVVEGGVVIEHLGGTDMAYGIDNLTNGKGTSAVTTVKEATVKSPYRAIRQFLNGIEATNELYVKAGAVVEGANKSIWMQDPNVNANTGKLVVEEGAQLKGDVYLYVCAGSTEWPVEVSLASAALVGESKVLTGNVPAGYQVIEENGIWTVVEATSVSNAEELQAALAEGKNVSLANDLTISSSEMLTAPYGNKMAVNHKGGVFNGNGNDISVTAGGDSYVVMTTGGTIKNLNIDRGFRGIVVMYPDQDLYVDNVKIGVDDEVCYTINTAEGDGTHSLYISNSELNGWCSIGSTVKDVTFTNCKFGQGTYYTNVWGRLVKPYVNAVFDGCDFCSKCYIDLSAFVGTKVVVKNCTVNGVKLTAENWASIIAPESTCGEGQISVELKDGTYLTTENVADYFVIE